MKAQPYSKVLDYIDDFWPELITAKSQASPVYIELPNPFVSPSSGQFHNDQFYWDTYFILLGLVEHEAHLDLARGMVDNLLFLYKTYGIIPMRNRTYDTGISQPPLLTSMIRLVYDKTRDKIWLNEAMVIAEQELHHYWMNTDSSDHVPDHLVLGGLSRYADHHLIDQTAEHESGWDMTSRFNNMALSYLPIDLNSLLYKYESDIAWWAQQTKDTAKVTLYQQRAAGRAQAIHEYHYNQRRGFFFDYHYPSGKQSSFWSLAGFYPLWAGLATPQQAARVHKNLKKFEHKGGLATSLSKNLLQPYRQWDYPNGWAPLHWLVINGLRNYGFVDTAERITHKWLSLNERVFEDTGKLWEKYNVVDQSVGRVGRYPNQEGFGWTNGVFVALTKHLSR